MNQIDITDKSLENILLMYRNIICDKKLHSDNKIPKSPNNPSILAKCYAKEIAWADGKMDSFEKEFQLKNICERGCSMCCRQSVYISLPEALAIKNEINKLDNIVKQTLKEKVNIACDILRKNGLSDITMSELSKDDSIVKEKYFSLAIACPLLNENNACVVHSVRAISCCIYRAYGSSMDCKTGYDVKTAINYGEIGAFIQERMFKSIRFDGWYKPLPMAIHDMLSNTI